MATMAVPTLAVAHGAAVAGEEPGFPTFTPGLEPGDPFVSIIFHYIFLNLCQPALLPATILRFSYTHHFCPIFFHFKTPYFIR